MDEKNKRLCSRNVIIYISKIRFKGNKLNSSYKSKSILGYPVNWHNSIFLLSQNKFNCKFELIGLGIKFTILYTNISKGILRIPKIYYYDFILVGVNLHLDTNKNN